MVLKLTDRDIEDLFFCMGFVTGFCRKSFDSSEAGDYRHELSVSAGNRLKDFYFRIRPRIKADFDLEPVFVEMESELSFLP